MLKYQQLAHRFVENILPKQPIERALWAGEPTLSIVCDDGSQQDFDAVAPILESFSGLGTFAVTADLLGQPGHMHERHVAALAARGHEIASHFMRHKPAILLSQAQCIDEMVSSQRWLKTLGAHATTLAYPYGANARATRLLASRFYAQALTAWPGIVAGPANRYALRRLAFGAYDHPRWNVLAAPEVWLDRLLANRGWMIIMLHPGAAHRAKQHDAQLARLLQAAVARGIHLRTVASASETSLRSRAAAG
jgi:peptidoglycan/xylan/chitin deacetylase (PgdA/CDA1 family)